MNLPYSSPKLSYSVICIWYWGLTSAFTDPTRKLRVAINNRNSRIRVGNICKMRCSLSFTYVVVWQLQNRITLHITKDAYVSKLRACTRKQTSYHRPTQGWLTTWRVLFKSLVGINVVVSNEWTWHSVYAGRHSGNAVERHQHDQMTTTVCLMR